MFHEVIQVIPQDDFTVYVYFVDGSIKLFNMKPFIGEGVFRKISSSEVFRSTCTVMNHTLAWDVAGGFNKYKCIDMDPVVVYESGVSVKDPLV